MTPDSGAPEAVGFDPDEATQRAWLEAAAETVMAHLRAVSTAPTRPAGARGEPEPRLPVIGEAPMAGGIEAALALVAEASDHALATTSPGYLAYIPGGGLLASALADLVSEVLNRYTGLKEAAPALRRMEEDVLGWLAAQLGYDGGATGLLTSGGSLATFGAIAAARDARLAAGDYRKAIAYTSNQAHGSVAAAFRMAGVPAANLRLVPVDREFRMDAGALDAIIRADRESGLEPFLVIAAAGTTNTGAIDPLPDIAASCARHRLWLHVDGAYGGAFMLCAEGRRRLAGMAAADSITIDPHKGLFLPYGTGCLLFREPPARSASDEESYLQDLKNGEATASATEFRLELSRPFRGLRLWLPLMLHGAGAFRAALAEKLVLAETLHERLERLVANGLPVEIVAGPQLTVVPFRLKRRAGEGLAQWNARNAAFLDAINRRDRVYLSSTLLAGPEGPMFTLRACVLCQRTSMRDIEHCLTDVEAAAAEAA